MRCNRCGNIFDISEAAVVYRKYGSAEIKEKRCPNCNGTFKHIQLPSELDTYLYVNNDERYYSYSDNQRN